MMLFDDFTITPANRLAHAACRAVAEEPDRAYNPLWLHGEGLDRYRLADALSEALTQSGAMFGVLYRVPDQPLPYNVDDMIEIGIQIVIVSADAPSDPPPSYMTVSTALAVSVSDTPE